MVLLNMNIQNIMKIDTLPYLYKWTQLSTGMWYIGSKTQKGWTPLLHEKYICSSKIVKPMIVENRQDWVYDILVIGSAKYIRELETSYLVYLDAKNNVMSYNRSNAKFDPGNKLGYKESLETRQKKSNARKGDKNPMFGKTGLLSPHYGKTHNAETIQKQKEGVKKYAKSRPPEHNKRISEALTGNPKVGLKKEKNPSFGKPWVADRINLLPPKTCEYCNKSVSIGNFARWHGEKCKFNKKLVDKSEKL